VNAEAQTVPESSPERQWWLRTLAVFQSPRPVFAALRDPSPREAEAREEPILAIIILAGISVMLLAPESGRILDDSLVDNSKAVLAVSIFLSGSISGALAYWIGGALVYLGLRGAGSEGTYRRARHILAFAAVPTVLALLLVWPARLLVYGTDSFRTGGDDHGLGPLLFDLAEGAFILWSAALLVYGIAVVERWRILRAGVAVALPILAILIFTVALVIPLSSR
jgi:hypothetical protein